MLRVVCTRLCAVLMGHELDARPNKLMLKKKKKHLSQQLIINLYLVYLHEGEHACIRFLWHSHTHVHQHAAETLDSEELFFSKIE